MPIQGLPVFPSDLNDATAESHEQVCRSSDDDRFQYLQVKSKALTYRKEEFGLISGLQAIASRFTA